MPHDTQSRRPPAPFESTASGETSLDVLTATPQRLRQLRLEKITMVFQHFALLPHRTVAENVEYGLKMRGLGKAERRKKALATEDRMVEGLAMERR